MNRLPARTPARVVLLPALATGGLMVTCTATPPTAPAQAAEVLP